MYKRAVEGWAKHWDFVLLDVICLQIAFIIGYSTRYGFHRFVYAHEGYPQIGLLLTLFALTAAAVFNTMHSVLRRSLKKEIRGTLAQCLAVFAAVIIFLFSKKDSEYFSRVVMYTTLGIYTVLSFTVRMLYKRFLLKHKLFGRKREILLVAPDRETAEKTIALFESRPEESIHVCGVVLPANSEFRIQNSDHFASQNGETAGKDEVSGVPVVADTETAADYICANWIDEVYVAGSENAAPPAALLAHCAEMGVTVHQELLGAGGVQGQQRVEKIAKRLVLTSSIRMAKPWQLLVKRAVDILAGLLLSVPAVIAIVILTPLIKSRSNGPVLLKQERIGQNGRKFKMLSIRTMYMDAERRMRDWRKRYPDAKVTLANDPRIIGNRTLKNGTQRNGIGLTVRKLSLDVLPQAFNVLAGQMSLVGTRAPSVEEWEKYQYHHRVRLACKPGITGLWQASGRSRSMSFEEATKIDTAYIARWSLGMDAGILFRTIGAEKRQR